MAAVVFLAWLASPVVLPAAFVWWRLRRAGQELRLLLTEFDDWRHRPSLS